MYHQTAVHASPEAKLAKKVERLLGPGAAVPKDKGVYTISMAAEFVGTGAQNLRLYEARGLVEPERTDGGTRRYSEDDIARLQRIARLLDQGLNLAGISLMLELESENADLREQNEALRTARRRAPG
ncbi:MerR family transcriptional regulator [Knoellia sp. S7-12]|uniref:MerR family transcriptional regulator n=1 Tax=Knoellia sp. S7-12 TaxID=3126698 RepID=UPI003367C797